MSACTYASLASPAAAAAAGHSPALMSAEAASSADFKAQEKMGALAQALAARGPGSPSFHAALSPAEPPVLAIAAAALGGKKEARGERNWRCFLEKMESALAFDDVPTPLLPLVVQNYLMPLKSFFFKSESYPHFLEMVTKCLSDPKSPLQSLSPRQKILVGRALAQSMANGFSWKSLLDLRKTAWVDYLPLLVMSHLKEGYETGIQLRDFEVYSEKVKVFSAKAEAFKEERWGDFRRSIDHLITDLRMPADLPYRQCILLLRSHFNRFFSIEEFQASYDLLIEMVHNSCRLFGFEDFARIATLSSDPRFSEMDCEKEKEGRERTWATFLLISKRRLEKAHLEFWKMVNEK